MGFWNDREKFDTKRAYRWIAIINRIEPYAIKSVSKPSFSISETSHRFLNHTYYYPGRVEWNTVDVVLVDPLSPDGTKTILHLIEQAGYDPNIGVNTKLKTMSKSSAVNALANFKIKQLDASGASVEVWDLVHPWIKDVKFSDLSYDSDDLMNINLTIRFDWAEVWTKNDPWPLLNGTVPGNANFPSSKSQLGP
jgi:hypothetical protein